MKSFVLLLLISFLLPLFSVAGENQQIATIREVARAKYLLAADGTNNQPADSQTLDKTQPDAEIIKDLSLSSFLHHVIDRNQQLGMYKTDLDITRLEEAKTHAIFEPDFIASVEVEENNQRNSVEESLSRSLATTYSERNWHYSLSINGLAPSGAKYNLGYNLRDLSNSVTRSLTDEDHEYMMFFGVSLTQPLLKDAGQETTKAGIHAAQAETAAALQDYRQKMMQTIHDATVAYWNYYLAQEQLELRLDSLRMAEKILADNREKHRTGKMAETEVFEAMTGVISRKSSLNNVERELLAGGNRLRSVLSIEATPDKPQIRITDKPTPDIRFFNKDNLLEQAFHHHPDYLEALAKLGQADIKIAYARNQRYPELDLKASYGLNGLDFEQSGSWQQLTDADYDSWAVGMEFRIPLFGGIDSKSELQKVELEKKRLLLTLKDVELRLSNNIDTSIHNVNAAIQQLAFTREIAEIQHKLLDSELAKHNAGKSNSHKVLEREENYRSALEEELKSQVNLQTALVELELTDGSILLNHGLEISENEK